MTITETDFNLPQCVGKYRGKVRDVYNIHHLFLVLVASDRVSAFDHVFTETIPYKGQVLSQLAYFFFKKITHICPHHVVAFPDPNVTIGIKVEPYPIEMIVRGYLCGHAWRVYKSGERTLCGVQLPEGLRENDPLPEPIITPTTKSMIGHDIDITEQEITKSGLMDAEEYARVRYYALELYKWGAEWAKSKGLILADTKFEFGIRDYDIYIMDEIFTPDSSRYFFMDGYDERQNAQTPQPQYSKEHLRKWLLAQGYQGQEDIPPPHLSEEIIAEMSARYIEVYEKLTGLPFEKADHDLAEREARTVEAVNLLLSKVRG
jgi:phosphoribosylaminoimidazole-succinocarboxamide synthase